MKRTLRNIEINNILGRDPTSMYLKKYWKKQNIIILISRKRPLSGFHFLPSPRPKKLVPCSYCPIKMLAPMKITQNCNVKFEGMLTKQKITLSRDLVTVNWQNDYVQCPPNLFVQQRSHRAFSVNFFNLFVKFCFFIFFWLSNLIFYLF